MDSYQKATKVRKVCENINDCIWKEKCPYLDDCRKSEIIFYSPIDYHIETVVKAIQKEKWNVK